MRSGLVTACHYLILRGGLSAPFCCYNTSGTALIMEVVGGLLGLIALITTIYCIIDRWKNQTMTLEAVASAGFAHNPLHASVYDLDVEGLDSGGRTSNGAEAIVLADVLDAAIPVALPSPACSSRLGHPADTRVDHTEDDALANYMVDNMPTTELGRLCHQHCAL